MPHLILEIYCTDHYILYLLSTSMDHPELESLNFESPQAEPEPVKTLSKGSKSRIKKELSDMENTR